MCQYVQEVLRVVKVLMTNRSIPNYVDKTAI